MIFSNFKQANTVMDTPKDVSPDLVEPIRACRGQYENGTPFVITCWKPTRDELDEIQKTGRVWLTILGAGMPPVYLSGKSPFKK